MARQQMEGGPSSVDEFISAYVKEMGFIRPSGGLDSVVDEVPVSKGVHLCTEIYGPVHELKARLSYGTG